MSFSEHYLSIAQVCAWIGQVLFQIALVHMSHYQAGPNLLITCG